MIVRELVTSALLIISMVQPLIAESAKAGTKAEQVPKLIVGIAIEQLRTDYLYALQSRFCDNGFKKLLAEGRVYEHVVFQLPEPDATSALAVLATGSYPFANGICAGRIYNPAILREQSIFHDTKYLGNYTSDTYSPIALIGSTLGDELKSATHGNAKVYSIAPDAEAAIIGAGHGANCAFWIDDKTGKWATTTYYKDVPHYADRFNRSDAPYFNIELKHWIPSAGTYTDNLALLPYQYVTEGGRKFDHQFLLYGKPHFPWFKTSALVNEAVTKFGKVFLQNGGIGKHESPDMLQITYYAGTYQEERADLYPAELEDTYLRLDLCIADLLQTIENTAGLENTFIYLTATGDTNRKCKEMEGVTGGEFNAHRCTALLNSYLMSIYGPGNWVNGFNNNQIFLEHKIIEDKQIRLGEIQKNAAEFVTLFSGVQEVVTAHQILYEDYNERISKMRNAYHKRHSGDLFITLQPGWALKIDDNTPAHPQTRHDVAPGPAIFYSPGKIPAQKITVPIDATCIAPSVARFVRIRAPSTCRSLPIYFK